MRLTIEFRAPRASSAVAMNMASPLSVSERAQAWGASLGGFSSSAALSGDFIPAMWRSAAAVPKVTSTSRLLLTPFFLNAPPQPFERVTRPDPSAGLVLVGRFTPQLPVWPGHSPPAARLPPIGSS